MLKGKSQKTLHLLIIEGDQCKLTIALEAAIYLIVCSLSNLIVLHSQLVCALHTILSWVTMVDASYLDGAFSIVGVNHLPSHS